MKFRSQIISRILAIALVAAPTVAGAASWIEAVDGDLSGNRLAPSALALTLGSNHIAGTTVLGDLDYLTINVPTGYALTALDLVTFISTDDLAFMAIQAGTTLTEPAVGTVVGNLLGWAHFGPLLDYLPVLGAAPGAIGFSGPLAAGDYTLWLQQTGSPLVTYDFDAVLTRVSSVPEPASGLLLSLGLVAFGAAFRRRSQT